GVSITQFMESHHRSDSSCEESSHDLVPIIEDILTACKKIADAINRGALDGTMGSLASENIQGEVQKALDVICNEIFLEINQQRGLIVGMASEEMEDRYIIPEELRADFKAGQARYLMLFDPLDGSSNVNLNVTVGTIFSILRCPDDVTDPALEDF